MFELSKDLNMPKSEDDVTATEGVTTTEDVNTEAENSNVVAEESVTINNTADDNVSDNSAAEESVTTSDIDHLSNEDGYLGFELYEGFAIESLFETDNEDQEVAEEGKLTDWIKSLGSKKASNYSTMTYIFNNSDKSIAQVEKRIKKFDTVQGIDKFISEFNDLTTKINQAITIMEKSCAEFKKSRETFEASEKTDSDKKKLEDAAKKFKKEMNSAQKLIKIPLFINSYARKINKMTTGNFKAGSKTLNFEIDGDSFNSFSTWINKVQKMLEDRRAELVKERESRLTTPTAKVTVGTESETIVNNNQETATESKDNDDMDKDDDDDDDDDYKIPTYETYIKNCMKCASEAKDDTKKTPSKKPLTKKEYLIAMTSEAVKSNPELRDMVAAGKVSKEDLINMDILKEKDDMDDKKTEETNKETPASEGVGPDLAVLGGVYGSLFAILGVAAAIGSRKTKKKTKKAYNDISSDLTTLLNNVDKGIEDAENYKKKNKDDKDTIKATEKLIKAYTSYRVFISSQIDALKAIKETSKKDEKDFEKYADYLSVANEVTSKTKKFLTENSATLKEIAKKSGIEDVDKYFKDLTYSSKYAREFNRNKIAMATESIEVDEATEGTSKPDNANYNWKSNFDGALVKIEEFIEAARKSNDNDERIDSLNHASRDLGELERKIDDLDLETYKNIPKDNPDSNKDDMKKYKKDKIAIINNKKKEIDDMRNSEAKESYTKEEVNEFLRSFGIDENGNDIVDTDVANEGLSDIKDNIKFYKDLKKEVKDMLEESFKNKAKMDALSDAIMKRALKKMKIKDVATEGCKKDAEEGCCKKEGSEACKKTSGEEGCCKKKATEGCKKDAEEGCCKKEGSEGCKKDASEGVIDTLKTKTDAIKTKKSNMVSHIEDLRNCIEKLNKSEDSNIKADLKKRATILRNQGNSVIASKDVSVKSQFINEINGICTEINNYISSNPKTKDSSATESLSEEDQESLALLAEIGTMLDDVEDASESLIVIEGENEDKATESIEDNDDVDDAEFENILKEFEDALLS